METPSPFRTLFREPPVPARSARALSRYLPRVHLARIAERDGCPDGLVSVSHETAILFLDISGFTALTGRLAEQGARGAESLSKIIDAYFGRATEICLSVGGDLLAFAGDAAWIAWPADSGVPIELLVQRAAWAALAVQHAWRELPPIEGVSLHGRAGVSEGQLDYLEVGGSAGQWLALASGPAITDAATVNAQAAPGEVVITRPAWQLLDSIATGTAVNGAVRIDQVPPPPAAAAPSTPAGLDDDLLARYLPAPLGGAAGTDHDPPAEFRTVTIVFVPIGRPGDAGLSVARLHEAVGALQEVTDRYEGTVYQLLTDDKGTTLIAAFGLPPLAHEQDARRGVLAAGEMVARLEALGIGGSAGVTTGPAFCGVYGSTARRQYAVVGEVINRAARLAATGETLCDAATRRAAGDVALDLIAHPPIRLEGITDPVEVWRIGQSSETPSPRPGAEYGSADRARARNDRTRCGAGTRGDRTRRRGAGRG